RAWGSARELCGPCSGKRSIPTCVGLGGDDPGRFPVPAVHPHVRGARESVPVRAPSLVGPSPRAWGSAQELVQYVAADRSIPTCVGLGPRWSYIPSLPPVHPHVRGARPIHHLTGDPVNGPSPRAWGSGVLRLQITA